MNYLFDISPTEIPDSNRKKARQKAEVSRDGDRPQVTSASRFRNETIIGRSSGHYTCVDSRCGSTHFDILDDWRGQWFIECMICGTGQYVPAVAGVLKTPEDAAQFVFLDGRFEGFSIAQVADAEHGQKYIEWSAANHKREAVRIACRKWIDRSGIGE